MTGSFAPFALQVFRRRKFCHYLVAYTQVDLYLHNSFAFRKLTLPSLFIGMVQYSWESDLKYGPVWQPIINGQEIYSN